MRLHPTPPVPRAATAGLAVALLGLGVASSANDPPAVVFKTRPPASGGVISGQGPLDVTFNMCPTSDEDPGDSLKFTYDFDGDGSIDYYGHCRQTHRYPASNRCVDATVCASDRNPGHRLCRTYSVCASGADRGPGPGPSPSPSPSPSPDILPFTYDLYSFTAKAGTNVDVSVDTVSAATTFDPWACISTTPEGCALFDENVIEWGDDDQACTFPPPADWECPAFTATLPADGVYYLLVSDAAEDAFAGPVGLYALHVTSDAPIGPLSLKGNNVPDPADSPPAVAAHAARGSSRHESGAETAVAAAPKSRPSRPVPVRPSASAPAAPASHAAPSAAPARPARPEVAAAPPADSGTAPAITSGAEAPDDAARPEAAFRTEPRANADGRITGDASFDVTFDLCASKSPDPGRELVFAFDFDGDGVVDGSGPCRQTHHFEFDGSRPRCVKTRACAGDGTEHHEACRTYTVCEAP